jgi:hypothetical protein
MVKISTLQTPENYGKEEIEGRKVQLVKSIKRNGIKKPIVVNEHADGELIIIDGVKVKQIYEELGFEEIIAYVINVPVAVEKELQFTLNNIVSENAIEIIDILLGDDYLTYFPNREFDKEEKAAIANAPKQHITKMNDRLKQVISHLNTQEVKWLEMAKEYLECKTHSETIKIIIEHYVTKEGLI